MTKTASTRRFIPAAELRPGDRLYKHGVPIRTVSRDQRGNVVLGYTHTTGTGTFSPTQKFHVARPA